MEPSALQQASQQLQGQQPPFSSQDTLEATNAAVLKKRQQQMQDFLTSTPDPNQQAALTKAVAQINPNKKDTVTKVGKAIQTPSYAGYCLQWVDDQQGNNTQRQPTAFADFQANLNAGNIKNSNKVPDGARVYFSPNQSNGNLGHVGISNGDGTFTSATDSGIKTFKIADWEKLTGQQMIGWANTKK